jgi:hypothetical protein
MGSTKRKGDAAINLFDEKKKYTNTRFGKGFD